MTSTTDPLGVAARNDERQKPVPKHEIIPKPLEPSCLDQPSIAKFPPEIIQHLLSFIDLEDLEKISKLSSALFHQVRYDQQATVSLRIGRPDEVQHGQRRLRFLADNSLLNAVRVLKIRYDLSQPYDPNFNYGDRDYWKLLRRFMRQLAQLVPLMKGLRDIHWEVRDHMIPLSVFNSLSAKTRMQFSLLSPFITRVSRWLNFLKGNPNLASICLRLKCQTRDELQTVTECLISLLKSCPKFTRIPKLGFHNLLWQPTDLFPSQSESTEDYDAGDEGGEDLPEFNHQRSDSECEQKLLTLEELGLEGENNRVIFFEKLLKRSCHSFDWSRLTKLRGASPQFGKMLGPELSGLKTLMIGNKHVYSQYPQAEFKAFLVSIPRNTIESLTVLNCWAQLDEESARIIAERQGQSLRSLTLGDIYKRSTVSVKSSVVSELSKGLLFLEELTIHLDFIHQTKKFNDVCFFNTMYYIGDFRTVRNMTMSMHFRSPYDNPFKPINAFRARLLFEYLHKVTPKLQSLRIDDPRIFICTKLSPHVPSASCRPLAFECGISLELGDANHDFIDVRCLHLTKQENEKLSSILKGTGQRPAWVIGGETYESAKFKCVMLGLTNSPLGKDPRANPPEDDVLPVFEGIDYRMDAPPDLMKQYNTVPEYRELYTAGTN
ncbi:hypothetical protein F5Y16DRAFT_418310 [Xylariaceae sp. FL0255]|nr:hypothetical protein F5Y16DRAFT_418310 [Xylariaceae sp. FL0255]